MKKVLRQDLKSFVQRSFETLNHTQEFLDNWHLHLISSYLEAMANGEMKRLIINIPPRSLKSICVSVAWPAWLLARDPAQKIICASYSNALSVKHGLDCKKIVLSDWYKTFFPDTKIAKEQNTKSKFATTQNGFRFATSVGGTLTGEGADFLIVDDPLTPMQALSNTLRKRANTWFEQTFTSRLNDPKKGVIVIVMQRLHVNDLTGFLMDKDKSMSEWKILNLPLISQTDEVIQFHDHIHHRKAGEYLHPARYSVYEVEGLKKALGSYAFSAQYQQSPISLEGGLIKKSWLQYSNLFPKFDYVYQSWDCAIKTSSGSDYSVCTTWGVADNKYYLIHVLKDKLDYPTLKRAILSQASCFMPSAIIVEDKASGQQIIQELTLSNLNIIRYTPKFDKITRLAVASHIFEAGRVIIPQKADWAEEFKAELFSFPQSEYDDQVDSATQFLLWFENKQKNKNQYMIRRF